MEDLKEMNELVVLPTEQDIAGTGLTGTKGFLLGAAAVGAGVGVWALIKQIRKNKIRKQVEEAVEQNWPEGAED